MASDYVYVLNQKLDDGTICPSVFSDLDSCIKSVIMEVKEHDKECDEERIRSELEDQEYYFDGSTEYYIDECYIQK